MTGGSINLKLDFTLYIKTSLLYQTFTTFFQSYIIHDNV